jgi:predicted HicB family RNase H-like nuclease
VARKRVAQNADSQLATRIPPALRRRVKLHCVETDVSVMDFVTAAIRERLARDGRRRGGR